MSIARDQLKVGEQCQAYESSTSLYLTRSETRIIASALSQMEKKFEKIVNQAVKADLVDVSNWIECNKKLKKLKERIEKSFE